MPLSKYYIQINMRSGMCEAQCYVMYGLTKYTHLPHSTRLCLHISDFLHKYVHVQIRTCTCVL